MNKVTRRSMGGKELVDAIVESAKEKLAENIIVIDLNGVQGAADWFIVCQGDNTVQNSAIADGIIDSLIEKHTKPWHVEGKEDGRWVLIDFSDVIVHVMIPEVREYYALESLWGEGRTRKVD